METSGRIRDALLARGIDAVSCDVLPTEVPGPHIRADVRDVLRHRWQKMIAHPTCTYLCNSGVRWLHSDPSRWPFMRAAATWFRYLDTYEAIACRAVENPIMHCYAAEIIGRRADQFVQPWWFGSPAFKATGLHLTNLPKLVKAEPLIPPRTGTAAHAAWSVVHRASPGPDRWRLRSATDPGLARAIAEQWG